ncbi:MAG: alanine racemase [Bacteroidetes bacterium]|jgi:alanine racemase|nr:alanine racemase [Bacteroidota bacterium]
MWFTSEILLSESNVRNNIEFIRSITGEDTLFTSVVKGNAYGHGIEVFVPIAQRCGVRHFSVFSINEAYRVKKVALPETTVMIMGMVENEALEWLIEEEIEFYVFETDRLEKAKAAAEKVGKPARIHLEIETGMNRTGMCLDLIPKVFDYLKKHHKHLSYAGLCTHYAGAESYANFYRIQNQIDTFKKIAAQGKEQKITPERYHTACSAALLSFPETKMDMARVGILQYGYWPSKETLIRCLNKTGDTDDPLKRAIKWRSKIMSLKNVPSGDFIGYGTSYLTETDMKIAAVPVGYGYGYTRSLSNQGRVLIHGQRMSVISIVNMNMILVDVTNLENVNKGDEVVLIGGQGDLTISVDSFGELSSQLNYELLTRLPQNTPRIVVN